MKKMKKLVLIVLCMSSMAFAGQTDSQPVDGGGNSCHQPAANGDARAPRPVANPHIPAVETFDDDGPSTMPPVLPAAGADDDEGDLRANLGDTEYFAQSAAQKAALRCLHHRQALADQGRVARARLFVLPGAGALQSVHGAAGNRASASLASVRIEGDEYAQRRELARRQTVLALRARINAWLDDCQAHGGDNGFPVAGVVTSSSSIASTSTATQRGSSSPRAIQSPVDEELGVDAD